MTLAEKYLIVTKLFTLHVLNLNTTSGAYDHVLTLYINIGELSTLTRMCFLFTAWLVSLKLHKN